MTTRTRFLKSIAFGVISILPATSLCEPPHSVDSMNLGMFQPLPSVVESPSNPLTPEKIALGKKLYLDGRLSLNKKISCNSCHRLDQFGVDREPTSPGHMGKRGERNSPSSFNAALHASQFWDGRAATVEEQALGPILNPVEMGMASDTAALERIRDDKEYRELFARAFPSESAPVTFLNMGKAIGAFERTLLTPSRFDEYLKGKKDALTNGEKAGLKRFVETGCAACHNGVAIGGAMFQKLGVVRPYPTGDLGRYTLTKNDADKYVFKVPSLRNVTETGPYFHDGSVKTLEEAVKAMASYQLGRDLPDDQVSEIVTFLRSLTGTPPDTARME